MGAIRDTVYNNYLTTYAPKELTRYDSHKKSELRSVYNSIVKLNKESPWHLPIANKDTQNYAVSLKENARQLHNTLASVGGLEEDGLFNKRTAYSSDTNVLSATFIGDATTKENIPDFTVEVKQLAGGQENLGTFLENKRVQLSESTYSFDLNINDMSYEFQFGINREDTNKEIQERLARLVNNASIGIKASIVDGNGRSAIKLTSEASGLPQGKEEIFSISDENTSMRKGAVEYFGLNYTSREASNAEFLLNGEPRESSSNRFTVGRQFELRLRGISKEDEPVTVGLKTDVDSLADNVSGMVNGYNEFMKSAAAFRETQRLSGHLVNEMKSIATYYGDAMENVGLSMDEDGMMSVDRNVLRESAMQSEDLMQTFRSIKDFSKSLMRKTDQVSLNPMEYVDKKIVAYKNPGHNFNSPYISSNYSGMMYNFYC